MYLKGVAADGVVFDGKIIDESHKNARIKSELEKSVASRAEFMNSIDCAKQGDERTSEHVDNRIREDWMMTAGKIRDSPARAHGMFRRKTRSLHQLSRRVCVYIYMCVRIYVDEIASVELIKQSEGGKGRFVSRSQSSLVRESIVRRVENRRR